MTFLPTLTAVLAILALPCPCFGGDAVARPNILWITSEDHGQQMGCYGDPLARTP